MKDKVIELKDAVLFLEKHGIGSGTNITIGMVAGLMTGFANSVLLPQLESQPPASKSAEEMDRLINSIRLDKANLEFISKHLKINGTLYIEIKRILEEYKSANLPSEVMFTENEILQLQSRVHDITGDGEVMMLFNKLLGVNAGN